MLAGGPAVASGSCAPPTPPPLLCPPRPAICRQQWEQEIDIAEITRMPEQRQPILRWRRVALLAAGGVLVSTALLRYGARR